MDTAATAISNIAATQLTRPPAPVSTDAPAQPISDAERINALDMLRGFALLGILLMNIIAFSMHFPAYDNPTVTGGSTGANLAVWAVLHVLAEGKMRCLFSLVFGASLMLLTTRLESQGRNSADIWYRRTLWLLLFGIIHAYLLWLGDILYPYALCGLALYPFRNASAKRLLRTGGIIVVCSALGYVGLSRHTKGTIERGRAAIAAEQSGAKLTDEQRENKTDYEEWLRFNLPSAAQIEKVNQQWRGSPLDVIKTRAEIVFKFHSVPYYYAIHWDIWSMMLIGMGLFKLGVLSAQRSSATYAKMMLAGYGIGIPLNAVTAWLIIQSNFDPVRQTMFASTYDIGRLSVALGHFGLIMLLARSKAWSWLTSRLGAVGQMAFSNYVMHSVICSIIFTGYGFAMFGRLERYQVYYVVAAICVFQLMVSPIWLRHFRFGPLEWCWRSLTYWKKQPMRRPLQI